MEIDYYQVLGVSERTNLEEIKRSYRKKALQLHPDVNKSPTAHQEFVLLNEAYQYVLKMKTRAIREDTFRQSGNVWTESERSTAKSRADEYARMKKEEFRKSELFRSSEAVLTLFDLLFFLTKVGLLIAPVWCFFFGGVTGIWVGLIFTFLTVHFWADIFTEGSDLNWRRVLNSLNVVVKTPILYWILVFLLSEYLFFKNTLNAQLNAWFFADCLFGIFLITLLINQVKSLRRILPSSLFKKFVLLFFTMNTFFLINSVFSELEKPEVYNYVLEEQVTYSKVSGWKWQQVSMIKIDGGYYDDYPLLRLFADFETMKKKRHVEYTFAKGCFGIRVLKKYRFLE